MNRRPDLQQRYRVVIDGSKALRAGMERVYGEQVEVQRCQVHKRRNVREYLPENCQKDYDRRMRNAYAMNNYAEAKQLGVESGACDAAFDRGKARVICALNICYNPTNTRGWL